MSSADWQAGCERCKEILAYGGMGHTMAIHSRNDAVILEFGLRKPAFRIVVNTPTTHGSIGLTTGLDPAMMLGCGGHGGNITSDNISPLHLLNIKRVAHEVRPASAPLPATPPAATAAPPRRPGPGLDGDVLAARVHDFLAARGVTSRTQGSVGRAGGRRSVRGGGQPRASAATGPRGARCCRAGRRARRPAGRIRV